jgi:hypothetical protein
MTTVKGSCHCGNIALELELTRLPEGYAPRACDCGFCRKHGAAYVSDPQGALQIRISDADAAGRYRHGSGQAEMLICKNCGVLLGALFADGAKRYATVNASALDPGVRFGEATVVSPQTLPAGDKVARWQKIWFADVRISGPDA